MEPLLIPCPQCGASLQLSDAALLGKMGKCPKCSHRFILSEPAVVELELATTNSVEFTVATEGTAADQLRSLKRRGRRGRIVMLATTVMLIVAAGLLWSMREQPAEAVRNDEHRPPVTKPVKTEKTAVVNSPVIIEAGPPIDLRYVPHGAGVLINLRPAELWDAGGRGSEILACLPSEFTDWAAAQIQTQCLFPPSEIEELKLCLIYRAPGLPLHTSGVVTLSQPVQRSNLLQRIDGERRDESGHTIYVGKTTSYLMLDDRKFAFCPTDLVEDWQETVDHPAVTTESFARSLQQTDRLDQLTVVFEPRDFRIHGEALLPANTKSLLRGILDWLSDDVETACWGVRIGRQFRSHLVLRARTSGESKRLKQQIAKKLKRTPRQIHQTVALMNPAQLGTRRVVGRFPAMTLAYQRSTRVSRDAESVILSTPLPERAAPNLTLGARLTWQESLRRSSNGGSSQSVAVHPTAPAMRIADRLQMKIDCDFRRSPLYEALEYVGEEIGVQFNLAGQDLKVAGLTRNMPQEFKMDAVPALVILNRMLSDVGLVIVIDEAGGVVKVTTAQAASERGETPFPLSPQSPAIDEK